MHAFLLAALFTAQLHQPYVLPAQFVDGRVVVQANVNGKPMLLHLDSGSSVVELDSKAAADAGLRVQNGFSTADIDVGPFHAANVAVMVAPYGRRITSVHLSGILGSPFFESNVVTIDYPDKRVTVTPRAVFDPQSMSTPPVSLIELYHGLATVPVWYGTSSAPARMLLDTGDAQSMLFRPMAQRLGLTFPQRSGRVCGFGGRCFWTDYFTTGPLKIGTTEFRKAGVVVPQQALLSTKYYDGILGRDVLQAFSVTFDYADKAVYFELPKP